MKTVLCYGDSLTWGYDAASLDRHPLEDRWPSVLQATLGGGVEVIAEGLNGRTTAFDDHLAGPSLGRVLNGVGPLAHAARARLDRDGPGGAERVVVLDDERTSRYRYGTLINRRVNWQQASPTTLFDEAHLALSESPLFEPSIGWLS